MISNILILLIGIAAFARKGESRYAFLCFSMLCGFMAIIDVALPGALESYYYVLCAAVDLFIIIVLSRVRRVNDDIIFIQKACILFIVINLFGWVIYEMYIEPDDYNELCALLFAVILFSSLIKRNRNELGYTTAYSNINLVSISNYSSVQLLQGNKKAQRS